MFKWADIKETLKYIYFFKIKMLKQASYNQKYVIDVGETMEDADPSSRAVQGVGLRPLACCDRGFESHPDHGCLSVVSIVCC